MTRQLLQAWSSVADRLHQATSLALFLDFDGTLAPLASDPRGAVILPAARAALLRLARHPWVHAWVISGRRRENLQEMVGAVPGLTLLGVHGSDSGASGAFLRKGVLRTIADARRELASGLNGKSGILIEDKGMAFAVHHRNADADAIGRARRLLDRVLSKHPGELRILPGDRVWEVLPRQIRGKGDAVRHQWHLRSPQALPIYVGNDRTDESAFAALAQGITARVGAAKPTRAQYALRDCAEVARFLEQLGKEL